MGNDERSVEEFRVGDLVLLSLNFFRMTGFHLNARLAVLASEVGVLQVVAIANKATIGQLQNRKATV